MGKSEALQKLANVIKEEGRGFFMLKKILQKHGMKAEPTQTGNGYVLLVEVNKHKFIITTKANAELSGNDIIIDNYIIGENA